MSLIDFKDINKSYLNKTFNLKINNDSRLIVKGANGSGKSTLIKLLSGYIKHSKGTMNIKINKISYLEEIIDLPLYSKVQTYLEVIAQIKKAIICYDFIRLVELDTEKKIYELSKGNKQKLAIAVTLIGNNELIILDEPLNGLDVKTANKVIKYLKNITTPIIIVTHQEKKFKFGELLELWLDLF